MRLKSLFAVATAVMALGLASPKPAAGADLVHRDRAAGYDSVQPVTHHIYYPHYSNYYYEKLDYLNDRYHYRYVPKGYYPYYNSYYWKPSSVMCCGHRPHYAQAPYYKAWGSPKRGYDHVQWHLDHYGGHRRWEW